MELGWLIVFLLVGASVGFGGAFYVFFLLWAQEERMHEEFAAVHRDTTALRADMRRVELRTEASLEVLGELRKRAECWFRESESEAKAGHGTPTPDSRGPAEGDA